MRMGCWPYDYLSEAKRHGRYTHIEVIVRNQRGVSTAYAKEIPISLRATGQHAPFRLFMETGMLNEWGALQEEGFELSHVLIKKVLLLLRLHPSFLRVRFTLSC